MSSLQQERVVAWNNTATYGDRSCPRSCRGGVSRITFSDPLQPNSEGPAPLALAVSLQMEALNTKLAEAAVIVSVGTEQFRRTNVP